MNGSKDSPWPRPPSCGSKNLKPKKRGKVTSIGNVCVGWRKKERYDHTIIRSLNLEGKKGLMLVTPTPLRRLKTTLTRTWLTSFDL